MELKDCISLLVDISNIIVIIVLFILSRRNYIKDKRMRDAEHAYILAYQMNEPNTNLYEKRKEEFIKGARFALPNDVYIACLEILKSNEADIPNKIVMRIVDYKLTL